MTTNLNWDLDSIFPGGSQSAELADFLRRLEADVAAAEGDGPPGPLSTETETRWRDAIQQAFDLSARLSHASSFVSCLTAQDVHDEPARLLVGRLGTLGARLETHWNRLHAAAANQPDEAWNRLLADDALRPVSFLLNHYRALARRKMPPDMESLATELAADGYHAWNHLYGTLSGLKQVPFETDGQTTPLSLGQLQNKFTSHPDRAVRRKAFQTYTAAWQELAPACAMALNHQAGFRLTLYRYRGWDSVLEEPLFNNRLRRETLDAMWGVIADKSARLLDFFAAKARLLGTDRLMWYDQSAPVGNLARSLTFEEAANFIVENFRAFDPAIADFCRMAIDHRWVEAEDRPGKRAGAFCTGFPLLNQTRVFMTFGGTYDSMSTLAHELGHGYHNWAMRDLPFGARRYTMSVAETASTFNELAVTDAALRTARDDAERLSLLNQKLSDAATFMMNIRARYDFERAFFERRASGPLSEAELSALMLEAQQNAYHCALADDGYHPLFWASKLHFYITRSPFYNFPYTFGYLFSQGVYRRALAEGPAFSDRYVALLRDTGSMDTETLARTHLGVDLTRPDFWEETVDAVLSDVDIFVELANRAQ